MSVRVPASSPFRLRNLTILITLLLSSQAMVNLLFYWPFMQLRWPGAIPPIQGLCESVLDGIVS